MSYRNIEDYSIDELIRIKMLPSGLVDDSDGMICCKLIMNIGTLEPVDLNKLKWPDEWDVII